jgi:hypothetical protein
MEHGVNHGLELYDEAVASDKSMGSVKLWGGIERLMRE